jgi:hypothetical protein
VDDHTILAEEEGFGAVTVCPGGVVHINMPHITLKFVPADFVKFADLTARARLNFRDGHKISGPKPRLRLAPSPDDAPAGGPEGREDM